MGHRLNLFLSHLDSEVAPPLRIRLYQLLCMTTCGLCLLVVLPANLFQNLPALINVADALLGLFAGYCYWASKRGHHYLLGFFAVLMLLLEPVWFLNAGSEGSITYYFFVAILYPLAILRGRTRWVLVGLLMLNVCGLHLVEYFHPALTMPFQRPFDRLIDLVSGVLCSYLAIVVTLWLVLKTYDQEQLRLSGYAQKLAASEQNYREIFNATSDAILIRCHTGRLIDVNERMLVMFGYDRAAIAGLTIGDVSAGTGPYTQEEAMKLLTRTINEGPQTFRWRSRRRNGELFWSEIALRSCEIGGQKRIISAVRDISARVQAEQALRINEERLHLALAAAQQGWFEMNVQTGMGFSSEEYIHIIGFDPQEFRTTQQGWLQSIHPEDRERVSREYQACVAAGDSRAIEYRRQTKSGD
jgi:PAS domain S-box-containing protein